MLPGVILLFSLLAADRPSNVVPAPSAEEVIDRFVQRDAERRSALGGYMALRRYTLANDKVHKRAEMLVRVSCGKDGAKEFEVLSSSGWGGARKHVFPRLLEAERDASAPGGEDTRVTPRNYTFTLLRTEDTGGRRAYVFDVAPKQAKKYLMRGTIWVDAEEFAIVRIEGAPAKNPSFWIKSVRFAHSYEKVGAFWLPQSDTSVSDARIFGPTQLRIEYFDYVVNGGSQVAGLR